MNEDNGTVRIIGAADAADEQETEYYGDWRDDWSPEHLAFIRARTRAAVWSFVSLLAWVSFFASAWLFMLNVRGVAWCWPAGWFALALFVAFIAPRGGK